jgi:hypothetical protein
MHLLVIPKYETKSVYCAVRAECLNILLLILSTVEPRLTNVSHHEQIGSRTNFRKKNVSGYERCLE